MLAEAWRKASRQNIVLLTFGQLRNSVSSLQRSLGLLAGIGSELNRGISYRVEETADTGIEDGYQAAKRLFSGKTPPDAIFCVGDLLGLGVLEYLNEQGIACPKQVSVVGGCGNLDGAMQHGSRPFSNHSATIQQPFEPIGKAVVAMLLRCLENGGEPQPASYLPCVSRAGASTTAEENRLLGF